MLLNQLKTGTAASLFNGSRDGFMVRKARALGRNETLRVSASSPGAEGSGWLESATSSLSRVGSFLDRKPQDETNVSDPNVLVYKGTAVIMKKIKVLDLIDRLADVQDDTSEIVFKKRVTVQLIGTDVDPSTGKAMVSSEVQFDGWAQLETFAAQDVVFQLKFKVPKTFGIPGAIIVKNNHPNEFQLKSFNLELPDDNKAHFVVHSWVYNTEGTEGRIFFRNKAYLPADTPATLKDLREKELEHLRGDGTGERLEKDRIYDYDIYNDLGEMEKEPKLERQNLGGNEEYPFPRRMRTGRAKVKDYPQYETRKSKGPFYIPRDECFDRTKMSDFLADGLRSMGHSASSKISVSFTRKSEFDTVEEIKKLYDPKGKNVGGLNNVLSEKADVPKREQQPLVFFQEVMKPDGQSEHPLLYPIPKILKVDDKAWQNNDEFAREVLAGLNPVVITLVTKFPIKSTLDPAEWGDPNSAIAAKHIEGHLEGLSVEQAVSQKKLFVVDFHDAFLPFIEKINSQKNTAQYATRALFFNSSDGSLKTLAIELVLPAKSRGGEKFSKVLTPPTDTSKTDFMWELAKAHVSNNDIAAHQVFSHFTRCHAVTEAVIICSNRHLSKLHPIMQLMQPHFKSTLEINRQARATLIAAGGSIETHFTTRAYSLAMAAVNYRDTWTFESQALPNDLVARGMAVRDPESKHGVRLVLEDYPYAADGLELWSAIRAWNIEYVDIIYKDDNAVLEDTELQSWWIEMKTKAHEDKKDAPWPELNSRQSLAEILTIIQWIPSCQHAAVNFGQYDYAGFMPHHPTLTRRFLPEEGTKDWKEWKASPEKYYLRSLSNIDSTTTAMSVYEVLSAHSPCEEYIGERDPCWTENETAKAAFERFTENVRQVDEMIKARNADPKLKNRCGVVQMPYQLLRPKSESGVTFMGVPNSITI